MGEVIVMVPSCCPVMVWVFEATVVMVTPVQGSGGGGGVSVFLQLNKKKADRKNSIGFFIIKSTDYLKIFISITKN
jgi:hypothetical protein